MLNGGEVSPSISSRFLSFSKKCSCERRTDFYIITSIVLFQKKLLLIVSYSCTVTNNCESKSDILFSTN